MKYKYFLLLWYLVLVLYLPVSILIGKFIFLPILFQSVYSVVLVTYGLRRAFHSRSSIADGFLIGPILFIIATFIDIVRF